MERIPLACPECRTSLRTETDLLRCPSCERTYSQTLGIPNLCDSQIEVSPVERAVVTELQKVFPTASLEELNQRRLSTYQDSLNIDEGLREHYAEYTSSLCGRGQKFYRMFRDAVTEAFASPSPGVAMDLGCGTGAGLLPMAREFTHVVGLDVRMSSLIVAKKLIESHGISNVTLIQGSALSMPFPSLVFDYVTAINVLEHIFRPTAMLEEVRRILARGGAFAGDSRNRFDLLFPEPHAKLRWVGFLPRKWTAHYVRWRRGVRYETTHLLSYGDLRRALTATFKPEEWDIVIPRISTYGFPEWLENLVTRSAEYGLLGDLLTRLSPTQLALAHRSD